MADLKRREMLQLTAGAAIGARLMKLEAPAQTKTKHAFFTPDEFTMVDELSEMIIPTDDHSPGAHAAGVAAYIDASLAESFMDEPKTRWREGLKSVNDLSTEMNGKAFMAATPEQRLAVLTRMAQNEEKPEKPEELFFRELKGRTAYAYYTSKIGIHTEMEYKGNTYQRVYAGEELS
jgi:hypothetical protein